MASEPAIIATPAPWQHILLLCTKCSRKLDGGFGKKGKHELMQVLRDALKATGQRRALRLVEVGCLGLCPKRAVTIVSSARPTEMLAVPVGTDADAVLARLRLPATTTP